MDWDQIDKQMAQKTAKKSLMDKVLALPMTVRVIAAVVLLAVLAGAYVLIAGIPDKNDNGGSKNANITVLSDSGVSELEHLDWLGLADCSESEILSRFAGGSEKYEDDGYWYYNYNFVSENGKKNQYVNIVFDKDVYGREMPVSIGFSGNIISIYGVDADTDPKDVRGIFESQGLIFDGTDRHQYEGVEYTSEMYYTPDKADVQIAVTYSDGAVNNIDLYKMWDYGPDGEIIPSKGYFGEESVIIDEPVIEEKPETEDEPAVEEPETEVEEEPEPEVPAMTNDEAHRILLDGYAMPGEAWYSFADLTGDGIDELINMCIDDDGSGVVTGIIQVLTVKDGKAVKIMEKYNGDTNGYMVDYYLYTENGRNYILEYNSFMRQGHGEIYYKIYSFNDAGDEVMLRGNSYSGDMTSAEGESASDIIFNEFNGCKANSKKALCIGLDGFESDLR